MTTATKPTTEREHYIASFEREYQTTLRVLKAFPPDQAQMKFTPRSHTPLELASILALSQMVVAPSLTEAKLAQRPPQSPPSDLGEVVAMFEKGHAMAMQVLSRLDDATYNSTLEFPTGPRQIGPVRRADALWMMLFDTVHHRGQLTVYLRATGAKVPSIYGGSEAEPWS